MSWTLVSYLYDGTYAGFLTCVFDSFRHREEPADFTPFSEAAAPSIPSGRWRPTGRRPGGCTAPWTSSAGRGSGGRSGLPHLLEERERVWELRGTKSVFTIHNIEYQGRYGDQVLEDLLGLNKGYMNEHMLAYYGDVNLMKGPSSPPTM